MVVSRAGMMMGLESMWVWKKQDISKDEIWERYVSTYEKYGII